MTHPHDAPGRDAHNHDAPGPDAHGHDDHHHHDHGPGGHAHALPASTMAFAIGAGVNAGFVALQVVFGVIAGSVALLADALHNLGDVLGLLLAWAAVGMGRWRPTATHTYGYGRSSILAALANAVVLLVGCGAIALEAVQRFNSVALVAGGIVMWVAAAGILVNGGTALLFLRGQADDLNIRAAFLHLASDALVSLGVVVSGGVILLTGWQWVDPLTSLLIAGAITWGTWGVLKQSVALAMDAVPRGIDRVAVESALAALPGVSEVHDLHIWGLSTTQSALTVHLVSETAGAELVEAACALLAQRFRIGHRDGTGGACRAGGALPAAAGRTWCSPPIARGARRARRIPRRTACGRSRDRSWGAATCRPACRSAPGRVRWPKPRGSRC